jgi:hypothetical protein
MFPIGFAGSPGSLRFTLMQTNWMLLTQLD